MNRQNLFLSQYVVFSLHLVETKLHVGHSLSLAIMSGVCRSSQTTQLLSLRFVLSISVSTGLLEGEGVGGDVGGVGVGTDIGIDSQQFVSS